MPNFEKLDSVTPEASQQEPGGLLVTIFHTRPYLAVPEYAILGQWDACLAGIFFGCLRGRNKAPFPMQFR